jgi:two-component system NtrC family response regulator
MATTVKSAAPADRQTLLVVEDDQGLVRQLRWGFDGYELVTAGSREEAIAVLRRVEPAVVLQDLGLPPDPAGTSEGMATLGEIMSLRPQTKVIVMTGNGDKDSALRAIASGAWDFYSKPLDLDVLKVLVERAFRISALEAEHQRLIATKGNQPIAGIIANAEAMQAVCRKVEKVAPAEVSVLLLGESGTGKEVLARALHELSARRSKRFVAINCAAIPDQLLEAELFGYEKGAFTGAVKTTPGKVELADGGTLFLDEIGDMPPALQAKMLRFLQERVIERVGGRAEIPVDVRVVAATHQNLDALIADGRFRQDLYYRLAEVSLKVPALRERAACIPLLARHFLQKYGAGAKPPRRGFVPEAAAAMQAYPWPGNVRELENRVKTAAVMADGPLLTLDDLNLPAADEQPDFFNLREVRQRAERAAIREVLSLVGGNVSRASELLGISRPTLYDLLEKHGLHGGDAPAGV